MILLGQYTAEREEALEDAERRRDVKGHTPMVELPLKQIKTMPALFQPRELFPSAKANAERRTVDEEHVKSLKRAWQSMGTLRRRW
jgi:hypothetical protein